MKCSYFFFREEHRTFTDETYREREEGQKKDGNVPFGEQPSSVLRRKPPQLHWDSFQGMWWLGSFGKGLPCFCFARLQILEYRMQKKGQKKERQPRFACPSMLAMWQNSFTGV